MIASETLPPLCHLVGLRVSQVEPGGVTVSLPASPWLNNLFDVQVSLDILSAVTCELAGLAAVGPRSRARLVVLNTEAMRMARTDDGPFTAAGSVVHAGRTFVRVAATVRDGIGRIVGHAIGTLALAPDDEMADHPRTPPAPVRYATPDPPERPAPSDNFSAADWDHAEPMEVFRGVMTGAVPNPALGRLLGIEFLDLAPGSFTVSIPASRWFALQDDAVSPAILNTVSAIASGGSAMNLATDDRIVGEINRTIAFERPIPADDRTVLLRANTRLRGANLMVCDVEISDPDGNIAALEQAVWLLLARRSDVKTVRAPGQRRLATVLFTDIVASTERAATIGDAAWSDMLSEHQGVVRQQLRIFGGQEVKTTGDGFLATFASPANAVQCARAIRDRVQASGLQIRAGLHAGELEVMNEDVAGIAVHIASRILSACGANEVLVSSTVRDLAAGSGLRLENRGPHKLKGLEDEWVLYAARD